MLGLASLWNRPGRSWELPWISQGLEVPLGMQLGRCWVKEVAPWQGPNSALGSGLQPPAPAPGPRAPEMVPTLALVPALPLAPLPAPGPHQVSTRSSQEAWPLQGLGKGPHGRTHGPAGSGCSPVMCWSWGCSDLHPAEEEPGVDRPLLPPWAPLSYPPSAHPH